MAKFTMEQFERMLQELGQEEIKFDTALEIVQVYCSGKPYEELTFSELEIIQDVSLKVYLRMVATIGGMLKDESIPLELRAARFGAWLRTVKRRAELDRGRKKQDDCTKHQSIDSEDFPMEPSVPFDDPFMDTVDAMFDPEEYPDLEKLRQAFSIVISERSEIYIKLAWLGVHLFMIFGGLSKIDSTHYVVDRFSELPLDRYYKAILDAADYVPWIELSDEQKKKLESQLSQMARKVDATDGKVNSYAETLLKTFYMEKGGLASISDWINKFNKKINNKMKGEDKQ